MDESEKTERGELLEQIVLERRRYRDRAVAAEDAGEIDAAGRILKKERYLKLLISDLASGSKKTLAALRAAAWYGCDEQALRAQAVQLAENWGGSHFRGSLAPKGRETNSRMFVGPNVHKGQTVDESRSSSTAYIEFNSEVPQKKLADYVREDIAYDLLEACRKVHRVRDGGYVSPLQLSENLSEFVADVDKGFRKAKKVDQVAGSDRPAWLVGRLVQKISELASRTSEAKTALPREGGSDSD